jgi:para-nitrobenzyl esterase
MALEDTGSTRTFDGGGPEVARLSHRFSTAWLAFARHGDPNSGLLPTWPPYDPQSRRETLLFNSECRVADDPDGADRRTMELILTQQGKTPRA